MAHTNPIILSTQKWVDDLVVGLNFCPFAKREVERNSIHYEVCNCEDLKGALEAFQFELERLEKQASIETTLLILSPGFTQFEDYLDLLDMANLLLDHSGYRGHYQLASFHPDYCFEGTPPDSPENFTNRSPYPVLHLLRESTLDRVLKVYKDPENIPQDNMNTANRLGVATLTKLLAKCAVAE